MMECDYVKGRLCYIFEVIEGGNVVPCIGEDCMTPEHTRLPRRRIMEHNERMLKYWDGVPTKITVSEATKTRLLDLQKRDGKISLNEVVKDLLKTI